MVLFSMKAVSRNDPYLFSFIIYRHFTKVIQPFFAISFLLFSSIYHIDLSKKLNNSMVPDEISLTFIFLRIQKKAHSIFKGFTEAVMSYYRYELIITLMDFQGRSSNIQKPSQWHYFPYPPTAVHSRVAELLLVCFSAATEPEVGAGSPYVRLDI